MACYMPPLYPVSRSHKEVPVRSKTCSPAPKTIPGNFRGKKGASNWPPISDYADADGDIQLAAALEEAKLASEEIDQSLSVERSRRKKDKAIRILLLGMYAVSFVCLLTRVVRVVRVFHAVIPVLTRVSACRSIRVRKVHNASQFPAEFGSESVSGGC